MWGIALAEGRAFGAMICYSNTQDCSVPLKYVRRQLALADDGTLHLWLNKRNCRTRSGACVYAPAPVSTSVLTKAAVHIFGIFKMKGELHVSQP